MTTSLTFPSLQPHPNHLPLRRSHHHHSQSSRPALRPSRTVTVSLDQQSPVKTPKTNSKTTRQRVMRALPIRARRGAEARRASLGRKRGVEEEVELEELEEEEEEEEEEEDHAEKLEDEVQGEVMGLDDEARDEENGEEEEEENDEVPPLRVTGRKRKRGSSAGGKKTPLRVTRTRSSAIKVATAGGVVVGDQDVVVTSASKGQKSNSNTSKGSSRKKSTGSGGARLNLPTVKGGRGKGRDKVPSSESWVSLSTLADKADRDEDEERMTGVAEEEDEVEREDNDDGFYRWTATSSQLQRLRKDRLTTLVVEGELQLPDLGNRELETLTKGELVKVIIRNRSNPPSSNSRSSQSLYPYPQASGRKSKMINKARITRPSQNHEAPSSAVENGPPLSIQHSSSLSDSSDDKIQIRSNTTKQPRLGGAAARSNIQVIELDDEFDFSDVEKPLSKLHIRPSRPSRTRVTSQAQALTNGTTGTRGRQQRAPSHRCQISASGNEDEDEDEDEDDDRGPTIGRSKSMPDLKGRRTADERRRTGSQDSVARHQPAQTSLGLRRSAYADNNEVGSQRRMTRAMSMTGPGRLRSGKVRGASGLDLLGTGIDYVRTTKDWNGKVGGRKKGGSAHRKHRVTFKGEEGIQNDSDGDPEVLPDEDDADREDEEQELSEEDDVEVVEDERNGSGDTDEEMDDAVARSLQEKTSTFSPIAHRTRGHGNSPRESAPVSNAPSSSTLSEPESFRSEPPTRNLSKRKGLVERVEEEDDDDAGADDEMDVDDQRDEPTPKQRRKGRNSRRHQTLGDEEEDGEREGDEIEASDEQDEEGDDELVSEEDDEGGDDENEEENTVRTLRNGKVIVTDTEEDDEEIEDEDEDEAGTDESGSRDLLEDEEGEEESMEGIEIDLESATFASLNRLRRNDLIKLCEDRDLPSEGTKKDLITILLDWRENPHEESDGDFQPDTTFDTTGTGESKSNSDSDVTEILQPRREPKTRALQRAARDESLAPEDDAPLLAKHHRKQASKPETPQQPEDDEDGEVEDQQEPNILDLDSMNLTDKEIPPTDLRKLEKIGSGGFKDVFKGRYRRFTVAIADIRGHLTEMDIKELGLLRDLSHQNIVKFIGVSIPENPRDVPCMIVTELCSNGDLFDYIRNTPAPSFDKVLSIMLDIAKGLDYLHTRTPAIIHRDLKSSNVLITAKGVGKINDFGLARVKNSTRSMIRSLVGTVNWQAPELWVPHPRYNEKVDVFSGALVFWEMLQWHLPTKRYPFEGQNEHAIYVEVGQKRQRPPTATMRRQWGGDILAIIDAMWEQEPSARPQFSEVVKQLKSLLANKRGK